ncbi:hypothetical protein ACJMK2_031353 [Sinanodonta woodiana]|uniref:Lysosomal Pro-X carboxypeptidase n=1 Tax=Sinanodonta woodiana TaxID=1069815 RepID=A0ABD3WYI8_SINWO
MAIRRVFSLVVGISVLCLFLCVSSSKLRSNKKWHFPKATRKALSGYDYKTYYFKQQVDHFGFANADTFLQRFLLADQYWNNDGGPIFFYTGNEGDIAWFCNNTGFMWDIAAEFKALLVFAEHRYYGESIPYGSEAFKNPTKLNYLTSEQALADFADLINYLKSSIPGASQSPVIAFGGSYGGMLAAWFKMKYPNLVLGALAASAPILQFNGITDCEAFNEVVTQTFERESAGCVSNIRASWQLINNYGMTDAGRKLLREIFHLCQPLNASSDVDTFKDWLTGTWVNLAMVNYPYPANFLEPLPAWPVRESCKYLSNPATSQGLLPDIFAAISVYYNYTGQATCLDINQQGTSSLGDMGWDYQSCTEMVMPMCSNGVSDMFEPMEWNFTQYSDNCYKMWQVKPLLDWITTEYGGTSLESASNIVFSNGLLDPWSSGGVLQSQSRSLISILIPDGAHHLDLRSANVQDPYDLQAARVQEVNILKNWLNQV